MNHVHKYLCSDCFVGLTVRGSSTTVSMIVIECPECGEDMKWHGVDEDRNHLD